MVAGTNQCGCWCGKLRCQRETGTERIDMVINYTLHFSAVPSGLLFMAGIDTMFFSCTHCNIFMIFVYDNMVGWLILSRWRVVASCTGYSLFFFSRPPASLCIFFFSHSRHASIMLFFLSINDRTTLFITVMLFSSLFYSQLSFFFRVRFVFSRCPLPVAIAMHFLFQFLHSMHTE